MCRTATRLQSFGCAKFCNAPHLGHTVTIVTVSVGRVQTRKAGYTLANTVFARSDKHDPALVPMEGRCGRGDRRASGHLGNSAVPIRQNRRRVETGFLYQVQGRRIDRQVYSTIRHLQFHPSLQKSIISSPSPVATQDLLTKARRSGRLWGIFPRYACRACGGVLEKVYVIMHYARARVCVI
jgi:hypothetical protein